MLRVFASVLLLFCFKASAAAVADAPSSPDAPSSTETLLERDLLPGIVKLNRTVRAFHYFRLPHLYSQLETQDGRREEIRYYIQAVTSRFWDLGFDARDYVNAGPGLYLATDPYISRSFGNRDSDKPQQISAMLELTFSSGMTVLRVVNLSKSETKSKKVEPRLPLSNATLAALVNDGVVPRDFVPKLFYDKNFKKPAFFRDSLARMTHPDLREFRKMVMRILLRNGVQIIEYNWQSALSGFCRKHNFSSFNFIGRPNQSEETDQKVSAILVTDPQLPILSQEEEEVRKRVNKQKEVLSQVARLVAEKKETRALIQSFYSDVEFEEIKSHTYMCE